MVFSWTGVVLFVGGHYFFGMSGMTLGYHRLLTHRGFTCPKWLDIFSHVGRLLFARFASPLGGRASQASSTLGRRARSHSPLVAALWGHLGWLVIENRELSTVSFYEHYARDILRDPFYLWLERRMMWFWAYVIHAVLFFLAGLAIGWATTESYVGGVRFGASVLVWGVFTRTVLVWHITWSVNSLSHLWGYRNYPTDDNSRNNWLVGLLAHGEGWHNNHHAQPVAVAHGHRWWEIDFTYWTICLLEAVGLAKDVVRPRCGQSN